MDMAPRQKSNKEAITRANRNLRNPDNAKDFGNYMTGGGNQDMTGDDDFTPNPQDRHLQGGHGPLADEGRFAPNERLDGGQFGGRSGRYGRNEDYDMENSRDGGAAARNGRGRDEARYEPQGNDREPSQKYGHEDRFDPYRDEGHQRPRAGNQHFERDEGHNTRPVQHQRYGNATEEDSEFRNNQEFSRGRRSYDNQRFTSDHDDAQRMRSGNGDNGKRSAGSNTAPHDPVTGRRADTGNDGYRRKSMNDDAYLRTLRSRHD